MGWAWYSDGTVGAAGGMEVIELVNPSLSHTHSHCSRNFPTTSLISPHALSVLASRARAVCVPCACRVRPMYMPCACPVAIDYGTQAKGSTACRHAL